MASETYSSGENSRKTSHDSSRRSSGSQSSKKLSNASSSKTFKEYESDFSDKSGYGQSYKKLSDTSSSKTFEESESDFSEIGTRKASFESVDIYSDDSQRKLSDNSTGSCQKRNSFDSVTSDLPGWQDQDASESKSIDRSLELEKSDQDQDTSESKDIERSFEPEKSGQLSILSSLSILVAPLLSSTPSVNECIRRDQSPKPVRNRPPKGKKKKPKCKPPIPSQVSTLPKKIPALPKKIPALPTNSLLGSPKSESLRKFREQLSPLSSKSFLRMSLPPMKRSKAGRGSPHYSPKLRRRSSAEMLSVETPVKKSLKPMNSEPDVQYSAFLSDVLTPVDCTESGDDLNDSNASWVDDSTSGKDLYDSSASLIDEPTSGKDLYDSSASWVDEAENSDDCLLGPIYLEHSENSVTVEETNSSDNETREENTAEQAFSGDEAEVRIEELEVSDFDNNSLDIEGLYAAYEVRTKPSIPCLHIINRMRDVISIGRSSVTDVTNYTCCSLTNVFSSWFFNHFVNGGFCMNIKIILTWYRAVTVYTDI